MDKLKILNICATNFKGFGVLDLDFQGADAIILGGMNGYGKTGVFDALELLLTGRIKRYENYFSLHDKRRSISNVVRPLVNSSEVPVVEVSATFEFKGQQFRLKRSAKVADMCNPINFAPFNKLFLSIDGNEEHATSEDELKSLGVYNLIEKYTFLNYLSQEEATSFLKLKEGERANQITNLFNLSKFDTPLKKFTAVLTEVKRVRDGLEHKYSSLESDIKQLRQRPSIKNDVVQYISIADGSNLSWDVENPNLTDDQYILLLHEGGEIDQLKYFCKNQKAYNDYKRNYYTERYFSDSNLKNIALFVKCRIKSELLNKYKCLEPIVSYRIDDAIGLFNFLSISYSNYLDGIVPLVTWNDIIDKIKTFKELYNSMSEAQKNLSSLVNLRDKLSEQVKDSQNLLQDSSCPLCGHKYKDIDELLSSITHQTEILNDNLSAAGKAASEQFQTIKKNVCDSVISPIVEYFKSEGITPELFANYKKLDLANISRKIKILDDEFQIKIDDTLSETEIFADLRTRLNQLIVELPQDVDYNLLEKAYSTAAKFVNKDCLNEETIEKKRNYLTYCWNGLTYNILQQKQSELTTIQKKLDKAKGLYNRNKKLIDNLREVRGRYIQKVISDIEILFYIYSGRIMQNCLYGRGLFVRSVKKHEYILIASSKNKDDEVDALYNMSSGQLVSVSIALMLSLNKLYSKVAFVAIDDPVQTIDDINFYGLIETLRHDFDKSFMLMSTHEMGYQDLLVYKLRKWNINADKINMAQLFNRGNSI